ncbi:MAG: nucleotide sugar dehydrogenase [Candidatus Eremiobacteraeota bacterium]|nr:nucleotide sugar dehydrogenase [Candidatus Eremiobacteraeota bacterium]
MRNETISIVGGCGHVGLPLGIVTAEAGYRTYLYDLNPSLVRLVNHKQMPHLEEEGPERLAAVIDSGELSATTDPTVLRESSLILITIGTPVDEHLNPRLQDLIVALQGLREFLHSPEQLVVFRSTIAPGTLRVIGDQLQEWGCPVRVAYCPERIVQGKALTELKGLPQLVSGLDATAVARVKALFLALTDAEPIVLEPMEAELAKLFCNAWRYINFAISNQFYQIAEEAGANFGRIHEAAVANYPRMKEFARAGLTAGPCLLKDTMQLASFSRNTFFLGHSAMLVNEGLPAFLLNQLRTALGGTLRGKTIGLLGMAFKPDNDDTRESLSFKIRKLLLNQGAQVLCHDPFVQHEYFPHIRFVGLDEAMATDGVVIGVPHSLYRHLKFAPEQVCIDVWNSVKP